MPPWGLMAASALLSLHHSTDEQRWVADTSLVEMGLGPGGSWEGDSHEEKDTKPQVDWTGSLIPLSMRTLCACCLLRRTTHIAAHVHSWGRGQAAQQDR